MCALDPLHSTKSLDLWIRSLRSTSETFDAILTPRSFEVLYIRTKGAMETMLDTCPSLASNLRAKIIKYTKSLSVKRGIGYQNEMDVTNLVQKCQVMMKFMYASQINPFQTSSVERS